MTPKVLAGLGAAALVAVGSAFAQGQAQGQGADVGGPPTPAGGIPVGPLTVYPRADLSQGYDDNLFLRPSNTSSSSSTVVGVSARAEGKTGPHKFNIGLGVTDGRYHSSPADSYIDYSLGGGAGIVFSGRAGLALNAQYQHGHDARGSTDRGVAGVPDEYDNYGMDGVFSYGASGAQGRIEVSAGTYARRYTNNRVSTEVADRDTTALGGTFYWRVMPRTELLFQTVHSIIDYKLAASTQDSTEDRYLVGAKWDATAKTTGTAKFGIMNKKFDGAGRTNVSGKPAWDVGVRWSPLTYSVFDFTTSRQTGESTGVGDAIVNSSYGVTWSHAWSSRLRTQAIGTYGSGGFTGDTGLGRKDVTTSFGLKVDYDFLRWLRFGAAYTRSNRDSNDNTFNYKRNVFLFTVGGTL